MALQTVYLKNNQGVVHNSTGQISAAPWWSAVRSESVHGQSNAQLNAFSLDYTRREENHNVAKETWRISKIAPQDGKNSAIAISFQSSLLENGAQFDLVLSKERLPYVDQCHRFFSACGSRLSGRVLLPFSSATNDGPIYVNARQYHGILRRRLSRAKAMEGRQTRARKAYMHESRHLHATRRPRGCGGRFLNTKKLNDEKIITKMAKADNSTRSQSPTSQNPEVFQAECKDGLNHLESEMTVQVNRHVMDLGRGLFMPAQCGII